MARSQAPRKVLGNEFFHAIGGARPASGANRKRPGGLESEPIRTGPETVTKSGTVCVKVGKTAACKTWGVATAAVTEALAVGWLI